MSNINLHNNSNNIVDLTITDLFGNSSNISNDSYFILINSSEIYKLLSPIGKSGKNTIWEVNMGVVSDILYNYNLNAPYFIPMGHLYSTDKYKPRRIILINKSIAGLPKSFELIDNFNGGSLWYPIGSQDNIAIGLIYTKNNEMPNPDNINIGLVRKPYTLIKTGSFDNNIIFSNEYGILNHVSHGFLTLNKGKLYGGERNFKLLNNDGLYLTKNENDAKLKVINRNYKNNQEAKYSVQGELILDNKCLTNNNRTLAVEDCNGNIKQKWFPFGNSIISQYDDTCLATTEDSVNTSNCNNTENQEWTKEKPDIATNNDYSWSNINGKSVVLVESDNPWYLNKDLTIIATQKEPDTQELNQVSYSRARYNIPTITNNEEVIETFDSNESNDDNNIILIIIIITIILYVLYKYGKKRFFS